MTANNEPNLGRAAAAAPPPGAMPRQPGRFAHALPRGTDALVLELKERLAGGERFNNPRLAEIANEILGGTRAEGTFTTRDMYDAAEAAVNLLLLERDARLVLEMNDPKRALESTLRPLLAQLPRQAERDHEQITHQQFSTPPPLAYVVFWTSGARADDIVIESCAGTGSLAVWARAAGLEVLTNELSERRCALLELLDFHPTQFDAELIHEPEFIGESANELVRPSLALANPPWSATAGRVERNSTVYGANHVTSNLRRLAEGGRLVALVGGGMALDRPHFSGWWRRIVTRYNVRANVSVPGAEFARYGTTYDCQIIVIDKTGPTPGTTLREQFANVVHGRAHSLEHLIDLLDGVRSSRPECAPTRGYATDASDEDLDVINLDGGAPRRPDPAWAPFYRAPRPSGDDAEAAAAEPDRLDALEFVSDAPAADAPADVEAAEDEQHAPAADGRRAARRAEDVYVPYVTRKLTGGAEHPAQMVEAATMAAVDPPDPTYVPCLQPEIISEGRLSRIQLERVIYAGQRHEQRLFHGERGGFFIGDGTGSGKGRDLAAIGLDNWNQGRRRILWLSVSNDLIESARRDINDLGVELPLAQLNNFSASDDIPLKEGVIFCTYPTLISKSRTGRTRFDQLVKWLGPEGIVFFDECLPAGTMIATPDGERPIEELSVGDVVLGLNHDTGRIEQTPIRHLFRRETTEPLLQVNETLMTGNHPVWTRERDYVRADEVTPLDTVCELERESAHGREVLHLRMVPPVLHTEVQAEQEEREGAPLLQHVLLCEMEDEPAGLRRVPDHRRGSPEAARENDRDPPAQRRTAEAGATPALHLEPVLLAGNQGQIPEVAEGAGLLAPDGRQRRGFDRAAAEAEGAARLAHHGIRSRGKAVDGRLPEALHGGFGGAGTEARRGDRWPLSPHEATERAGRAQGCLPAGERLDRPQVQKRGGAVGPRTRGQADPQGRTVYNIETGTANYFANRLLVHNCHKAKNVLSTGNGHPTQTGKAVVKLQDAQERPDLRVVYSSATGAQDVRNLAYAVRLGLWGEGTPFADFKDFMKKIEEGGIGAMEMCCRDMKALGMYLAASLSYGVDPQSGLAVEYREVPHELTPQQREMYNAAAAAWLYVLNSCRRANQMGNGGERQIKSALQGYWGKHQRFFRLVIAAFKIPTVIAAAERALAEGRSPIFSLIGTGEARTKEQIALAVADGTDLEDLDFTPREVIAEAVMSCLPTQLYQDKEEDGEVVKVAVTNEDGEPVHCQEALELRRQVLESLTLLDLPDNPLDTLVNHFGAKNVAEITGRKKRLIRREDGRVEYVKRAPAGVATTKVNVYEQEAFQNGNHLDRYKTSGIISEAGSTGISLHASNRATNRRRREMIIIEYAWSADKQLQIMGRAHRTDQAYPPIFTSVPTDLGGERRFSSTIAMRLGSLGALTRGDRAAVDGGNLSKYNYETEHGKAALALLYSRILTIDDLRVPGLPDPRQTLELVGLITRTKDDTLTVRTEDMTHVPRFLNRVLALDVDRQNALFNEFDRLFRETVAQAKANGTFDEGVTDLRARSVRVTRPPRVVHVDRTTGARTTHYSLEVDFPTETVTFARAIEIKDERDGVFLQNKHTGRYALATRAGRHTDAETGRVSHTFCLTTPRWEKATYMGESELVEKFRPSYDEEARDWWTVAEALLPEVETCPLHVISGALLPLWERLGEGGDGQLSVIRVVTDDGLRIVGAEVQAERIARALTALGIAHNIEDTPDVFKAVLEAGKTIELAANMRLKRALVNRERAIELLGVHPARFEEFRLLGLINRQIRFKERFFVPTDEDEGVHVLNRLLERYPRVDEEATEAAAARVEESTDFAAFDLTPKVFDLEELVSNPRRPLLPPTPPQSDLFGAAVVRAVEAPSPSGEAEAARAGAAAPAPQEPADDDAPPAESEAEFASDLRPRRASTEAAAALLRAQQLKQRRKPKKKGGGDNDAQGSFF